MKLTGLTIAPVSSWQSYGPKNPLRAVVKLEGEDSTVECVLSDEAMRRMLALVADEVANAARQNVGDFVAAVTAIDADQASVLIGGAA